MARIRNYAIVTAAYWSFTLTDGALRMLVLLHFYRLGYSPFTLALLFLLYEAAGIGANLIGGWLATRYGITRMLGVGLATQIAGFLLLSLLSPDWGEVQAVAWAVACQGICGVAKDLTKTASKSAIKLTAGDGSSRLFRLVAWFTGSKNAMKGIGFFLGGLLLETLGFRIALWSMAGLLLLVLLAGTLSLPRRLGRSTASKSTKELFSKSAGINLLALARIGMFGARDVWFVVGVPVFLYAAGWSFTGVGTFLALWTIGYGLVQAAAPAFIRRSADGLSREVPAARWWSLALTLVPPGLIAALNWPITIGGTVFPPDAILVAGLAIFGFAFAINSSVHSYLILAYAGSEKLAEDVGFYYAANAAGRFIGVALSGILYQAGGIEAALAGSAAMLASCWLATLFLPPRARPIEQAEG